MAASQFPYQTGVPLGYRSKWEVTPPTVGAVRPSNFGAAAGVVDIGNAYQALSKKHDYDGIISNAFVNDANEINAKYKVEGDLLRSYAVNQAEIANAKYAYETGKDAINSAQSASNTASTANLFGKIASTALPLIAASDEKVKNTVETLENATSKLRALKPVTFYYNEDTGFDAERKHHGFVAQQYKEVLPDATYTSEAGTLCIDLNDVIGILVAGFQEIDSRITRLEAARALAGVN